MLELGGAKPPPGFEPDGVSLIPILRGEPSFPRPMYWRMNHRSQAALRDGDWKYLRVDGYEYLFNLAVDERERANLASREPDRLARMRQKWQAWAERMPGIPADATVSLGYGIRDMPQR